MRGFALVPVMLLAACVAAWAADTPPAATSPAPGDTAPTRPATSAADTKPPEPPPPAEVELDALGEARPGVIVHTRLGDGRRFSLYVPKAYDASRRWPLLVELTGRGIGRDNIARMWQTAETFQTVVAAPDTYAIFGKPGEAVEVTRNLEAWSRSGKEVDVPQTTRDRDDILRDLKSDADAVGRTVAAVRDHVVIDPELVVLTGYSGGAWDAYWTGLSSPEKYAGICVRSGSFSAALMPQPTPRSRKMPVNVVVGDRDLELVLADTKAAEGWFAERKFERFQVERLPHSGHDNRPEAAGNFVRFLQQELAARRLAEATAERDKYLKAGKASLERGETDKARHWLQKAADIERKSNLQPAEATELLEKMNAPAENKPTE